MSERLLQFCGDFGSHFQLCTRDVSAKSWQYLSGLMQAKRKNMERMAEVVPDSCDQSLQHFLSNSSWDGRALTDQVALEASAIIGDDQNTALIIDESYFAKKGVKSVGVSRQWNGRLGKVDNCQVGVFAALSRGKFATLIDARLYMPKAWIDDPKRCKASNVPVASQVMKSKSDLALEIVRHNRNLGVGFNWVGLDGGYGKEPALLRSLDDDGETFVADVHKDQLIYLQDPQPVIPERTSARGRKPTSPVAQTPSVRVDKWVASQPESAWKRVNLRQSTKGRKYVDVIHRLVWLWDKKENRARCWHLIVRREINARNDIKYSLSNASHDTAPSRLATMQGQRFWVERSFQDGKSQAGLADYQVRGWKAWLHHVALVMMAMLFMLKERIELQGDYPLLSCADIECLLAHFLPRRDVGVEEVTKQMQIRHRKRQASIDYANKKQVLMLCQNNTGNVTK